MWIEYRRSSGPRKPMPLSRSSLLKQLDEEDQGVNQLTQVHLRAEVFIRTDLWFPYVTHLAAPY